MGFTHITETKEWKKIQANIEEMKKEAILKEQAEKSELEETEKAVEVEKVAKEIKEPFGYLELNDNNLDYGYKMVSKAEYHRLAKQLTEWGVWNSGLVIKNEGAVYVKQAVDLTLACISGVKNPGAYFRKLLKNLKNMSS